MLTLKVINLYAGPGAGKSTLAAGLFNLMKSQGHSVELVTEYAKDLTWGKDFGRLQNQLYILAKQDQRLRRLEGQVDFAITDSPLPLGLAYMTPEYDGWVPDAIWSAFGRYRNHHVLVERDPEVHPYVQAGRNQTEAEAMKLDNIIGHIFDEACDRESYRMGHNGAPAAIEVVTSNEAVYEVYEEFVDEGL